MRRPSGVKGGELRAKLLRHAGAEEDEELGLRARAASRVVIHIPTESSLGAFAEPPPNIADAPRLDEHLSSLEELSLRFRTHVDAERCVGLLASCLRKLGALGPGKNEMRTTAHTVVWLCAPLSLLCVQTHRESRHGV